MKINANEMQEEILEMSWTGMTSFENEKSPHEREDKFVIEKSKDSSGNRRETGITFLHLCKTWKELPSPIWHQKSKCRLTGTPLFLNQIKIRDLNQVSI